MELNPLTSGRWLLSVQHRHGHRLRVVELDLHLPEPPQRGAERGAHALAGGGLDHDLALRWQVLAEVLLERGDRHLIGARGAGD